MNRPVAPSIRRQAAEWLVRLDHQPDSDTRQAFAAWMAQDPQHAEAVARLQGHLAPLQALAPRPAGAALREAAQVQRRSRTITSLALVAAVGASSLLGAVYLQQDTAGPGLSTASDERRSERLADGSQIDLDASSAVAFKFDLHQRRVDLLRGEILVEVAKDPQRPFYVITPQGSIRALGTRFIVERLEDATIVTMLESATHVESARNGQTLTAGQRLRLDAAGPGKVQRVDGPALQDAWDAHQLLAYDQPLSEVLERLERHRKGWLLFDRKALSAVRVTVMLPTDDSERALRLLARTLPVEVRQYTPWLTRISLKPSSTWQ